MPAAETQTRCYTPAEYFELEQHSEVRHEYFDGEIFAMAGASKVHNLLTLNAGMALRKAVRDENCQIFVLNVLLAVQDGFHYAYPDVVITYESADHRDPYLVRHPVLVAEVLSPSTEDYDREEKFLRYQKMPSLQHYVLIHQEKWFVVWYRRNEAGEWLIQLLNRADDVLEINNLNLRLPLAAIYDDTDVTPLRVLPPSES